MFLTRACIATLLAHSTFAMEDNNGTLLEYIEIANQRIATKTQEKSKILVDTEQSQLDAYKQRMASKHSKQQETQKLNDKKKFEAEKEEHFSLIEKLNDCLGTVDQNVNNENLNVSTDSSTYEEKLNEVEEEDSKEDEEEEGWDQDSEEYSGYDSDYCREETAKFHKEQNNKLTEADLKEYKRIMKTSNAFQQEDNTNTNVNDIPYDAERLFDNNPDNLNNYNIDDQEKLLRPYGNNADYEEDLRKAKENSLMYIN